LLKLIIKIKKIKLNWLMIAKKEKNKEKMMKERTVIYF
jgi:hypothetical protein